jgi:hypothetical protein
MGDHTKRKIKYVWVSTRVIRPKKKNAPESDYSSFDGTRHPRSHRFVAEVPALSWQGFIFPSTRGAELLMYAILHFVREPSSLRIKEP